jgi:hypothetical protein
LNVSLLFTNKLNTKTHILHNLNTDDMFVDASKSHYWWAQGLQNSVFTTTDCSDCWPN